MPNDRVRLGRREWITWGGTAVVAWAFSGRRLAHAALGLPGRTPTHSAEHAVPSIEGLLAPYAEGARLARWTLEKCLPFAHGSLSLILSDKDGTSFQLDVYARDAEPDAPQPPGRSEVFDVFLANGGAGQMPSLEEHGLAAMAVAAILRQNEGRVSANGFVTMRERMAAGRANVLRFI
jgi:hypothetical protein